MTVTEVADSVSIDYVYAANSLSKFSVSADQESSFQRKGNRGKEGGRQRVPPTLFNTHMLLIQFDCYDVEPVEAQ